MENKPIVTCHGDQTLFSKLHHLVVQGLPREQVEWRRSYGRPPRTIRCEAIFVPFNPDILPTEEDTTLLGRPFFHTYWTDCDIDGYKAGVKEEIADWLAALKAANQQDWLVITVVNNDDSKVKTKILRQSVHDKVKSDFCNKQADRVVVLQEPLKTDSKSSESWGNVLTRMRQLLLESYNKCLTRFEEHMRTQREKRQEDGWSFNHYFLLQEELAFMFEMLSLYEDALVQYDELDALFTQFILNHAAGATASWLSKLCSVSVTQWDGLCLSQPINIEKRLLIKRSTASLLDFRDYLFSRQCMLLFLLGRPTEMAQRAIPFMHNCLQELDILTLGLPPGAVDCWVFLSCLEVLGACDKFQKSGRMETHSLHTASLWDYARTKLCAAVHSSDLEAVGGSTNPLSGSDKYTPADDLIRGSTPQGPYNTSGSQEPLQKLKEALSWKDAFRKLYMELSELAMGTYKHIGRIRSARLIGKDLAEFYLRLGEPLKAEGFLMDALKTYKQEHWELLAAHCRLELADCQLQAKCHDRYSKSVIHICGSPLLDEEKRLHYQEELSRMAQHFTKIGSPLCVHAEPIFHITSIAPTHDEFSVHQRCYVTLTLDVQLPKPVTVDRIAISLVQHPDSSHDYEDGADGHPRVDSSPPKEAKHDDIFPPKIDVSQDDTDSIDSLTVLTRPMHVPPRKRHYSDSSFRSHRSSVSSLGVTGGGADFFKRERSFGGVGGAGSPHSPMQLKLEAKNEYTDNKKNLLTTSIVCKSPVKRMDSGSRHVVVDSDIAKEDFSIKLLSDEEKESIEMTPGINEIKLIGQVPVSGIYTLWQLCISMGGLEFIKNLSPADIGFDVLSEEPDVTIEPVTAPLYAGITQAVLVTVHTGSREFPESGSTLRIKPSEGLIFKSSVVPSNNDDQRCMNNDDDNDDRGFMDDEGCIALPGMGPAATKTVRLEAWAELHPTVAGQMKRQYEVELSIEEVGFSKTLLLPFQHPFRLTHVLHTSSKKKYIQVLVQGTGALTFDLSQHTLTSVTPGVQLTALSDLSQTLTISDDLKASYLWEMEMKEQGEGEGEKVECDFSLLYHVGNNSQPVHKCSYNFTLENFKTLFSVTTTVTPSGKEEECKVGHMSKLDVRIQSKMAATKTTDNEDEKQRYIYDILPEPNSWGISGKHSGVFSIQEGGDYTFQVTATPLVPGFLHHPTVNISHYIASNDDKESPSTGRAASPALLRGFNPGQVYQASSGQQVTVLPALNFSAIEITSET